MSILQQLLNSQQDDEAFYKAVLELFTRGQLYQELRLACNDATQLESLTQVAPQLLTYLRKQERLAQYQSRPADEQHIRNCSCPACRGRSLHSHQRRIFVLAMCVLHAHIHLREGQLLQANYALLRAARRLNPQIQVVLDAAQISVLAPTADLRRALHYHRNCPALNLIEELLYYYEHGSWLPATRIAPTTCLFVQNGSSGAPAKLVQEIVPESDAVGLTPGYYPHPELLLTVCIEQQFDSQFARAWQLCAREPLRAVRWGFAPFRNEGEVWREMILKGPSVGAAVAVGLACLYTEPYTPPDPDLAFVGELQENGHLTSVGGYLRKTDVFNKYPSLRLVHPLIDEPGLHRAMPDFADRFLPTETVQEAVNHALRIPKLLRDYLDKTADALNALPLANLTLEQVFVESRLQVRKLAPPPRPDAPQSTERSEDARREFPTRDYWEEEQARLYELLPLGSGYTTETVRWKPFTTTVLSAKARQVLVGAPGSGKTTATKALARQLALNALQQMMHGTDLRELTLPLWVRLSEVALDADRPIDALFTAARVPDELRAFYREMLQSGRVVVFLDGLDELGEASAGDFSAWLAELLKAAGSTPVLLTCRTLPWEQGGRKEWAQALEVKEPYELAPLNLQEQRAFVQKFYANDSNSQSDLLQQFNDSFALRHLARTYLVITLIALLHKDKRGNQQSAPEPAEAKQKGVFGDNLTLAGVYRSVLRPLLRGAWRTLKQGQSPPAHNQNEAESLIIRMMKWGYLLFVQSPHENRFAQSEWFKATGQKSTRLLDKLLAVGFLVEAGRNENGELCYSVMHRSFLEYLTGAYLAEKANRACKKARKQGQDPHKAMRDSLTTNLLGNGNAELIAQGDWGSVHRAPQGSWLWYAPECAEAIAFMASALEDATPLLELIEAEERKYPREVFRHLLVHKARVAGYGKVNEEKREAIVQEVLRLYFENEHPPRDYVLPALRGVERYAVDALIKRLEDADEPWGVRHAAAWALGWMGDTAAVSRLILLLQDVQDEQLRWVVIEALGRIGDAAAVSYLIPLLQDVRVRSAVIMALEWIGDAAVPELIPLLQDERVREAVIEALGRIGDTAAVPYLIRLLDSDNVGVRRRAVTALGDVGGDEAVSHLIRLLHTENNRWVRRFVISALGKSGNPSAVPVLIQLLDERDHDVRSVVIEALGRIRSAEAVPAMLELMRYKRLVRDIVWALRRIADPSTLPQLINIIQDKSVRYEIRSIAIYAVGDIGDPKAISPLIDILRQEPLFSDEVTYALTRIGTEVVPSVLSLINSELDQRFRHTIIKTAVKILGLIGDARAIDELRNLLEQGSSEIMRQYVTLSLGQIGDQQIALDLVRLLQYKGYEDRKMRREVYRSLHSLCRRHRLIAQHPEQTTAPNSD